MTMGFILTFSCMYTLHYLFICFDHIHPINLFCPLPLCLIPFLFPTSFPPLGDPVIFIRVAL